MYAFLSPTMRLFQGSSVRCITYCFLYSDQSAPAMYCFTAICIAVFSSLHVFAVPREGLILQFALLFSICCMSLHCDMLSFPSTVLSSVFPHGTQGFASVSSVAPLRATRIAGHVPKIRCLCPTFSPLGFPRTTNTQFLSLPRHCTAWGVSCPFMGALL